MVTVFPEELVLVSGSSLSLSCSIRPILVDTPTIIISSWTTPNSSHIDNAVNVDLNIPDVVTADSGLYTCSATVIPFSESQYILSSHPGNTSTRIIVGKCKFTISCSNLALCTELKVEVSGVYNAFGLTSGKTSGGMLTAGGDLILHCNVMGNSTSLTYEWSVMDGPTTSESCRSCSVYTTSTTSTLMVGIYSYNAGIYTCTVSEPGKPLSTNSDTFSVQFVG